MDRRDHIESPSVERRRLLEKRMEMIASLLNQMNEGENNKEVHLLRGKKKNTPTNKVL
jgi:hypothetical protein